MSWSGIPLTALVLAGSRGGADDPLVRYTGAAHKAMIEVAGRSMIERVVAALAELPEITRIVISVEHPGVLATLPGLQPSLSRPPISWLAAAASPAASVADALEGYGTPLLVTTADHALLQSEWVRYFCEHCPAEADAAVALASQTTILEAVPDTQRTFLRFRDGAYSGCNMFLLTRPAARGVIDFWRLVEAERKRPLRMIGRLGFWVALRYRFGFLRLASAMSRLSALSGARAAAVDLPFGWAAVDVDKPADLELVRRLLKRH